MKSDITVMSTDASTLTTGIIILLFSSSKLVLFSCTLLTLIYTLTDCCVIRLLNFATLGSMPCTSQVYWPEASAVTLHKCRMRECTRNNSSVTETRLVTHGRLSIRQGFQDASYELYLHSGIGASLNIHCTFVLLLLATVQLYVSSTPSSITWLEFSGKLINFGFSSIEKKRTIYFTYVHTLRVLPNI